VRTEDRLATPIGAPADQPQKRRRILRALPAVVTLVVIVAAAEAVGRLGLVSTLVFPPPSEIMTAFVELFTSGIVWEHLGVTMTETMLGFLLGAGGGFVLGVLASFSSLFRQIVSPYVVVLQVTPRVAIAPIFLTWFGFGMTSKVILAATICFFPVFINTVTGLLNVDPQARELFRSLRAGRMQEFRHLTLPNALPVIFAGVKTATTLALIGAIVAEFVGASAGLGLLIDRFNFQLATDAAFAVILLLSIIGLLFYGIFELIDRKVAFWQREAEGR
jgi:NitT/TauT family transport system permease protein